MLPFNASSVKKRYKGRVKREEGGGGETEREGGSGVEKGFTEGGGETERGREGAVWKRGLVEEKDRKMFYLDSFQVFNLIYYYYYY